MKKKSILIGVYVLVALVSIAVEVQMRYRVLPVSADKGQSIVETATQTTTASSTGATTQETTQPTTQTSTAVDVNDDLLLLVNDRHPVPKEYQPNLVTVQGEYQTTVDKRAAAALKQMLSDCRAAGNEPIVCSSYRTVEKQQQLFNDKVRAYRDKGYSKEQAEKAAATWVAIPGTSEHQTGLAVDISDIHHQELDDEQEKDATQQWLAKNCLKYGFILRYPEGKKDITHIEFEPWHYRYVGKENAKKIDDSGLCLEEYVEKMKHLEKVRKQINIFFRRK